MEQSDMNETSMSARVSALMDGEPAVAGLAPTTASFDAALQELSNDASARQIWLEYHQIGDLLRSSELAPWPRERQFLRCFSEQLGHEAVQLAPAAAVAAQSIKVGRSNWTAASVMAASFAVVALVSFSTLSSRHASRSSTFSARLQGVPAGRAEPQGVAQYVAPMPSGQLPVVASTRGQVTGVWSQYLMAHQQLAGSVLPYTPADIHEADFRVAASR